MRKHRIYTKQPLTTPGQVVLTGQPVHYLGRVLRVPEGAPIILFNGDGHDYAGEVQEISRQRVIVKLSRVHRPGNDSSLNITLVQAISRGERMDYTLQKATELGVSRIQPLTTQRVEVKLDARRLEKRLSHWQAVVISACEQSGRATVPEVLETLTLSAWLAQKNEGQRVVLVPDAASRLSKIKVGTGPVSILVGPEGGLTVPEVELITRKGVMPVSLGPRILRTETAGPAAIAVLQAVAGDF